MQSGGRFTKLTISGLILAVIVIASASVASGQGANIGTLEEQKLEDSALFSTERFGYAIAIDGDTLAIGAPYSTQNFAVSFGSVYIYARTDSGWVEQQRLFVNNTGGDEFSTFGNTVALDGDTLLVGASDKSGSGPGSAYIFTREGDTWSEQQQLRLDEPGVQLFGWEAVIEGDTAVVGAPSFNREGRAFVFTRNNNTWDLTQEISNGSNEGFSSGFGSSIALDGDTLVFGDNSFEASVHVYERVNGTWLESQVLADDAYVGTDFGNSVAVDGDTLVVTARFSQLGQMVGSAIVFTRIDDVWVEQAELLVPTESTGFFGTDVAIDGDALVVGEESEFGSAHFFTRSGDTWTPQAEFVGSDTRRNRGFDIRVAIDGDHVIAGFPNSFSGAVFVFDANANDVTASCDGHLVTVDLGAGETPTDGDDVILGTDGPDIIDAGDGNDVICSGRGADVIDGGPGADIILSGDGADIVRAGDGPDVVRAGRGGDQVFAGQGRDVVLGEDGDDFISGGKGKDELDGNGGRDDIRGNEGTDELRGGDGNDELRGGQKADLIIGNRGNDTLIGGTRPDTLIGNAGVDSFNGGSGADSCRADAEGLVEIRTSCELG